MQQNSLTYTLRDNVGLFAKPIADHKFQLSFVFEHSRMNHKFEVGAVTFECIKLLNGQYSNQQIATKLSIAVNEVDELIDYLLSQNLIETTTDEAKHQIGNDHRFSRQLNFFSSFETQQQSRFDYQQKIEQAHVVILGVGSIGTWLAESLTRSGIGRLTLIDNDVVEISNLPRQGLFCENDLGRKKTVAAAERLQKINRKIQIRTVEMEIEQPQQLRPFLNHGQADEATVVVNCADYPSMTFTNTLVADACYELGIKHVLCGGYDGHLSFIGQTVIPQQTACWHCYADSDLYAHNMNGFEFVAVTQTQRVGGTIAPVSSITANIHALEVLKAISGYCQPKMSNSKAELDFAHYNLHYCNIPKNPQCPYCGSNKPAKNDHEH